MDIPITRASAYLRRNRTTHSWYEDWTSSDRMSRSLPSARTLEDHMRQARATRTTAASFHQRGSRSSDTVPVVIRARNHDQSERQQPSSSCSSPGPSTALRIPKGVRGNGHLDDRPSSAYSYDGGFFVTANNANKDFFVIHPEWVSEGETVKRLSSRQEAARKDSAQRNAQAPPRVITWKSYKRSRSAPPPKYRNPITWQD